MEIRIRNVLYKTSIIEDTSGQYKQSLLLKAVIQDPNKNSKKNQFLVIIQCKEQLLDQRDRINTTQRFISQSLSPKSLKQIPENNEIFILKWQIPMNNCQTQINTNLSNLKYNCKPELTFQYLNQIIPMRQYSIQFNKLYDLQSNEYKNLMNESQIFDDDSTQSINKAIQHELILTRSDKNRIPITLKLNQTVFMQNEKQIKIKLQSTFLKDPLPQVQCALYQRFTLKLKKRKRYNQLAETQFNQFAQIKEHGQQNNCEVSFQFDLNEVKKVVAPLYLGYNIQVHHIILIKIIFQQTNYCFCDWSQRIFDIFVPIEIVENINEQQNINEQKIINEQQNINEQQIINEQQNINQNQNDYPLRTKNYKELTGQIFKLDIWPQFCKQYQQYLQVEVLKVQKLEV